MDIELEKLKKLEHVLCDAIDILRDWQVEEVKPEEEKFVAYLARAPFKGKYCYLTACLESRWETVQKEYGAKTKLFVGAYDEVQEWYKARDKFASVIKAWEDGKELQFRPNDPHLSWQECQNPSWDSDLEYRVKPEEKQYRPYESSAEMIADFINRFKVNCPSYCEPLVWIKGKENDNRFLLTGFFPEIGVRTLEAGHSSFNALLSYYTYLDGSPCGMEVKE